MTPRPLPARDHDHQPYTILSWGAGQQSTALAAMVALGDLPPVDLILHCDTQFETRATRQARTFYTAWLRGHGLRVDVITMGDIRQLAGTRHIHMPFWTRRPDGTRTGHLHRQCNRHFKIRPARRHMRSVTGYHPTLPPNPPAGLIEQWIGISAEERKRCTPSRTAYLVNRWPLVEQHLTRADNIAYLADHGLPVPPPSSCIGCPFRSATSWLEMREHAPADWADAIAFDEAIRHQPLRGTQASTLYVYWKAVPLIEADLERDAALAAQYRARRHPTSPPLAPVTQSLSQRVPLSVT